MTMTVAVARNRSHVIEVPTSNLDAARRSAGRSPFLVTLGETQLWTAKNDTPWDHPFHLHGFFFVVLDEKGEPVRPLAWKDTVNIPMNETARFLVAFDERPGEWMFHCHVLDHADGGLMGTVQVGPVGKTHTHTKVP